MPVIEPSEEELWSELDQAGGQRRGEILLELADRCYQRQDMPQFETLVEAAADASENVGDDRLAAYARFNQGQGLFELKRYADAAERFVQAASNFQMIAAQSDVALSHQRAGDCFSVLDEHELAMEHWRTALSLFQAEEDHLSAGRVHLSLGNAFMSLDQLSEAEHSYLAGRAAFRQIGAVSHVAWADDAAAETLIQQHRTEEALALLRSCFDIVRLGTDDGALGYAGLRLGMVLRLLDRPHEAIEVLQGARVAYQSDDNLSGVARCDFETAHALRATGDIAEAETKFQGARAVFDAIGADDYVGIIDIAMGEIFLDRDRPHEAEQSARAALRAAQRAGDTAATRNAAALVAEALLRQRDSAAALAVTDAHFGRPAVIESGLTAANAVTLARTFCANELRDSALSLTDSLLDDSAPSLAPYLVAQLHEVRWRAEVDSADSGADLARAIALFLAAGATDRARELSRHLLSEDPRMGSTGEAVRAHDSLRPGLDHVTRAPGFDTPA